jgi:hypothetical protein
LSSTQASFQSADEDLRTVFTLPELTVRLETNLDSVIQPAAISLRLDMAFDLKASLND